MSAAIAGASLLILLLAALVARWLRSPVAALVLASASGFWLVANKSVEGPVLLPLTPNHGLTFADLFGFLGLYFALRLMWRLPNPKHHPHGRYQSHFLVAAAVVLFAISPVFGLFR